MSTSPAATGELPAVSCRGGEHLCTGESPTARAHTATLDRLRTGGHPDLTLAEGHWSVASLLRGPGVDVRTDSREARVLWRKLAGLAPYALLTTGAGAPVGPARKRYPRWVRALAEEAAEAAGRDGVSINADLVVSELIQMPDHMRSSMLDDELAGLPLELDAIAGPILRAFGEAGAPVTAAAVREILTLRDAQAPLANFA